MIPIRKIAQLYWSIKREVGWLYNDKMRRHMPKIRVKKPTAMACPTCGEVTHLIAMDTGDGWALGWWCDECDDYRGDAVGYFPFVFGWATYRDLVKYDIEVA